MDQSPLPVVDHQHLVLDGPLMLDCGTELAGVQIAYRTYGTLNASKSNAILICHALTGDQYVAETHPVTGKGGWWDMVVGPGLPIDTDRYFVIGSNVLGGCMGSTGARTPKGDDPGALWGTDFPPVTIRDMVRAQKRLVEQLGIARLFAVIGGSMGGMRALEWAVGFPERVARGVIVAVGARATAEQIALCSVQIRAIAGDPEWRGGDYYDAPPGGGPHRGLSVARGLGQISYRTELELDDRFGRDHQGNERPLEGGRYAVESYLEYHGHKLAERFDANTYIALSDAMNHHDVGRGRGGIATALGRVTAEVSVAGMATDRLYPLRLQYELAELIPTAADVVVIDSPTGHDGFLVETEAVGKVIRSALA